MLLAIETYANNAIKARCGWYIVSQGWKRNAPCETKIDGQPNRDRYHTLNRLVQFWMYTWMKPWYCESE